MSKAIDKDGREIPGVSVMSFDEWIADPIPALKAENERLREVNAVMLELLADAALAEAVIETAAEWDEWKRQARKAIAKARGGSV